MNFNEDNVAESILYRQTGSASLQVQPSPTGQYPIVGDPSNTPPDVQSTIINSKKNDPGKRCVSLGELIQRAEMRQYFGIPTIGANVYPYVLSDVVPTGKYWIVREAYVIRNDFQISQIPLALWMVPQGGLPAKLTSGTDAGADTAGAFAKYNNPTTTTPNGPPFKQGLRVDDGSEGSPNAGLVIGGQGVSMLKGGNCIIVPPSWALVGYPGDFGGAAATFVAGNALELRIFFTELTLDEEPSY